MKINQKWYQSRKFWLAVGTIVGILVGEANGIELDPEQLATIAAIVVAWIARQGATDAQGK